MNPNTLNDFHHGFYDCFGRVRDALFNIVDTLTGETSARNLPEWSFSPFFERTWTSLYEALEDGWIDAFALLLVSDSPKKRRVVSPTRQTLNLSRFAQTR